MFETTNKIARLAIEPPRLWRHREPKRDFLYFSETLIIAYLWNSTLVFIYKDGSDSIDSLNESEFDYGVDGYILYMFEPTRSVDNTTGHVIRAGDGSD